MSTYTIGRVGLTFRGAYDSAAVYNYLDVVRYNGASYVAKAQCTGIVPTNTDNWELLAGSNIQVVYDSGRQTVSYANSSEKTKFSYTVPSDGLYAIVANAQYPTGTGGTFRFMAIKYTRGGDMIEIAAQTCPPQSSAGPRLSTVGIYQALTNDVIVMRVNQNSGGTVSGAAQMTVIRLDAELA